MVTTIRRPRNPSLPALLLGLAILIYAIGFSYLTVTRYAAFEARALDLGNLHQTVWNTANGRPFHMTNQPGTLNRLSLHVEPILLPLAALYWLHDGPETLLVVQSLVVALGAWPLYALANWRLRNRWMALVLALVFLLNPTIQAANWLEFHPVTLAPTFLMAAFYFLVTKRNGWFALFALLAASCKEEIGLLLFMVGLYALIFLRRPRIGLATMALSLSWSLIAVLGIQQFFADGNIHWGRYDYLGSSPLDKVVALLTQPALVWQQLAAADTVGYLLRLLWPVGFIALFAPEILLLALPSLAINLLADFSPMHQVYTLIYAAPILPFVMLAMVGGVARVAGSKGPTAPLPHPSGRSKDRRKGFSLSQVIKTLVFRMNLLRRPLILVLITGSALLAQQQQGYLPGGGNYQLYPITDHDRRAASIIAQIPLAAKVSAQDKLDPHVAGRETIYIFPRVDDADTIFLDVTGPAWPLHPSDLYRTVQQLLAGDFGVAAADDGYLLLRKAAPDTTLPAAFYSAFRRPLPPTWPATQSVSIFGEQLALRDHQLLVDDHDETIVQLYWSLVEQPVSTDYRIYVAFADRNGNVLHDTLFYPPVATLWYPTSSWQREELVLVQTLPWALAVEQFTVLVGVYEGEDGWQNGQRLPLSSASPPARLHLEDNTLVRLDSYQRRGSDWQPVVLRQTLTKPAEQVDVQFGHDPVLVRLQGIALQPLPSKAGDTLTFALEWQAAQGLQTAPFDYAIFAHLLNEQGEKVAQLDWQPHDDWGPRPMTSWVAGTSLVDQQALRLPATLPPGNYVVVLGVYNWQTGTRLATSGEDAAPGDVVTLAHLSIK